MSLDISIRKEKEIECKCCGRYNETMWSNNITHNLCEMAEAAGLYKYIWRPEENGIVQCKDIISILRDGLKELSCNPYKYDKYNPDNGWGSYDTLVKFVSEYLVQCEQTPDAFIDADR